MQEYRGGQGSRGAIASERTTVTQSQTRHRNGDVTCVRTVTREVTYHPPSNDCFPAGATVMMAGGGHREMEELRIGDRVMALAADGTLRESEVYCFGHRDATANATYVSISLRRGVRIELSPEHLVAVVVDGALVFVHAKSVRVGDVLVYCDGKAFPRQRPVESVGSAIKRGLYAP